MSALQGLDRAGRRRSPATMPGYHAGRPPANKGRRYPADPPRVEEIVAVMREAGESVYGDRLRGLIVVLWRAGLRLHLAETDLEERRGAMLIRHGNGDKRREVGMDDWGWEQLRPWLSRRATMPVGTLFCVIDGPSIGRPWTASAARCQLRRLAAEAGVRRRFAPHQLRHAHAIEMPARAFRSSSSSASSATPISASRRPYLQGIDNAEIVNAVHARRAPMMPASAGLRL